MGSMLCLSFSAHDDDIVIGVSEVYLGNNLKLTSVIIFNREFELCSSAILCYYCYPVSELPEGLGGLNSPSYFLNPPSYLKY